MPKFGTLEVFDCTMEELSVRMDLHKRILELEWEIALINKAIQGSLEGMTYTSPEVMLINYRHKMIKFNLFKIAELKGMLHENR